jgi:glycerophosphoryl diester phosphodiesterase
MKGNHPYSHYIAHRGLHDAEDIDENSYEAFSLACEKGYAIECDVHLTKDQQVVVHHDATTDRMMDENLDISQTNYCDLVKLKHKNSMHSIMLLKDLFTLIDGKVPLLIELKYSNKGRAQDQAVSEALADYIGDVAVQSFDPFSCLWFKKNNPSIKRGLLVGHFEDLNISSIKKFALRNFLFVPLVSPDFIGLDWKRGGESIAQKIRTMCDIGFIAWTVDTKESYEFCKRYFDNIIFENEVILEKK